MLNQKPWRRVLAAVTGVGILAFTCLVVSNPLDFERLYLKMAGAVIEGVNDKLAFWLVGFGVVGVLGWAAVGLACLFQKRQP